MHIKIDQNTSTIEEINRSTLAKLYDLSHSNSLDPESLLRGRVNASATYQDYIDELHTKYPEFYISANSIYKYFEDPIIEKVFADWVGDGIGSTMSQLNSITSLPRYKFAENQNVDSANITSFNELGQLTTIKTLGNFCFRNCSNLQSIDTSNIEHLEASCFYGCSSLQSVDVSNVTYVGQWTFQSCSALSKYLNFPKIETIGNGGFQNSLFQKLEFGPNLTSIEGSPFWDSKQLTTIIFHSTTVPSYSDPGKQNKFVFTMSVLTIYVPDESVNDYKNAWTAMADNIKGISELPS